MLQATVDRLAPLAEGVLVVTGVRHLDAVREQLPELGADSVLAEPLPRDSMAAIGLAAAVLAERHGDGVVLGSFAADHVVTGDFAGPVREGVAAAHEGYVVTIGIEADGPSTAFGYIHAGDDLGVAGAPSARRVRAFTEKPDAETAAAYLAAGEHVWNAGMFLVRVDVLLGHLARLHPALHDGLREIARAWDAGDVMRDEVLDRVWPGLERIAIDHAIAEPVAAEGGVAVVPASFGWDDVGDFDSLVPLVPHVQGRADAGPVTLGAERDVLAIDAHGGLVVAGSGRLVTVLGLSDVVVVDTPDALLVTSRAHAQGVKAVVDAVRAAGRGDLL